MAYFNNCSMIFLEVNEPGKAPDLRYITVGTTDLNYSDEDFLASATDYFKEIMNHPVGTTINVKDVQRFESQETYIKFLQNQLDDYLKSSKCIE